MNTGNYLLLLVAAVALPGFVSWGACWGMRRWAAHWGLVDRPAARKLHSQPMPLGGGIAFLLGVLVPFCLGTGALWFVQSSWLPLEWLPEIVREHRAGLWQQAPKLWLLLGFATGLGVLGLIDDLHPLPWTWRLGTQLLVAAVTVLSLAEVRLTLFVPSPWFTNFVSILWIAGMINAFNMLDNMDGLSAGVASIASASMALLLITFADPVTHQPQLFVAGLTLVIAGSLLGFLAHNFPPARIFLGDAGSYAVGYLLAASTLLATYATTGNQREHAVLAPLCILAVPLYDMLSVIIVRLWQGRSPFEGDKNHFSHRLVRLGCTPKQAVLTIYGVTAITCLAGILMPHTQRLPAVGLLLLVLIALGVIGGLEMFATQRKR
jgi:UDP-GlcNAc:undecaprenyl-phosphate/decaprenyl-phosphate GlcNAc-1-phosphate transferase